VSRIDPRPDRRGATSQASPSHVMPCIPGLAQRRAATPREALQMLAKERRAVLTRQEKLVTTLREPLGRLGYRLEAVTSKASRAPQSGHAPGRTSGVTGPLACPECSSTYALPPHVGRHITIMHAGTKAPMPTRSPSPSGAQRALRATASAGRKRRIDSEGARQKALRRTARRRRAVSETAKRKRAR